MRKKSRFFSILSSPKLAASISVVLIVALMTGISSCDVSPAEMNVGPVEVTSSYQWVKFVGYTWGHAPSQDFAQNMEWSFGPDLPGRHQPIEILFQVCADAANLQSIDFRAAAFAGGCENVWSEAGVEKEFDYLYGSNWKTATWDEQFTWGYWSTLGGGSWQAIPRDWFYSKCNVSHSDNEQRHIAYWDSTDVECTAEQAANHEIKSFYSDESYKATPVLEDSYTDIQISLDDGSILQPDEPYGLFNAKFTYGFDTKTKCDTMFCPLTLGAFNGHVWNAVVENEHGSANIDNIKFSLHQRPTGTYNTATKIASFATNEVSLLFRYVYAGQYTNSIMKNKEPLSGILDPDNNTFSFGGVFGDNAVSLEIHFEGTYSSMPPTAIINAPDVAECTNNFHADVLIDGTSEPIGYSKDHSWWVKGETGNYIPQEADDQIVTLSVPLGNSVVRHKVVDFHKIWDTTEASIEVVDTTPPEIDTAPKTYVTCIPNDPTIILENPEITDTCTDDSTLIISTFIKSMNGYDAGMVPVVDGKAILPIGESIIVWRVVDQFENVAEVEQTVFVNFEIGPWCCDEETQTMVEGTEYSDNLIQPLTYEPWCILSYGGQDNVFLSGNTCSAEGDDFVAAGSGGDYIIPRSCDSTIVAQSGDDFVYCANDETVYGGEGQDNLSCTYYGYNNVLYGGYGSDFIYSGGGDDVIYPGPGVDQVYAGIGDDVVIVYHSCELEPGKLLDGGIGNDTLYIPVSQAEAQALGVTILGFESIILTDPMLKGLSDCALE